MTLYPPTKCLKLQLGSVILKTNSCGLFFRSLLFQDAWRCLGMSHQANDWVRELCYYRITKL